MSLQRGANIRGWEGVTRNLAASPKERAAWNFSLFSMVLTLLAVGIASYFLSQSDIPSVAKAVFVFGVLLFTTVMISGVSTTMVRRAEGQRQAAKKHAPTAAVSTALAHKPALSEPALSEPAPVVSGTKKAAEDTGTRPQGLNAARDGKPDDLTRIKGVGPKLAELCHSLGFYHFDQIAAWNAAEVAWVDQNLEGFKGRVTRDEWVSQAQVLAAGENFDRSATNEDR